MMKIAIVGLGQFGCFFAMELKKIREVVVTDTLPLEERAHSHGLNWIDTDKLKNVDIIFICVPLAYLVPCLRQIKDYLKPGSIVIDVCSVKEKPLEILTELLPTTIHLLGTHPLFGPQSAKNGVAGHTIVLCPTRITPEKLDETKALFHELSLVCHFSTAEAHDKEMAKIQALTHFISRGLDVLDLKPSIFATSSYQHLLALHDLLKHDSWELFETIENGNPYAKATRQAFINGLENLEAKLNR